MLKHGCSYLRGFFQGFDVPTSHVHIFWMTFGFLSEPPLRSLSLLQPVEAFHCGSAPKSLSRIQMRKREECSSVPQEILQDGYLDCCKKKRVNLPSSPPSYSEEMKTVQPQWALWDCVAHEAGKAQNPRQQTERGHFLHKGTEQPQLQLHPKHQQLHQPTKRSIQRMLIL